nr:ABC transporter domain-containing protein [Vibrio chagasii]
MKPTNLEQIKKYLSAEGIGSNLDTYKPSRNSTPRGVIKELIDQNEHPLVKVTITDFELESGNNMQQSFLALHNNEVYWVRKTGENQYSTDKSDANFDLSEAECISVSVSFRYADPTEMTKSLIKRTPPASILLMLLVAFVMTSPMYSNLFNSRLVHGESVSSLLVVSGIFCIIFLAEFFLKEYLMGRLNRRIEAESAIAEDILFNKVIHSKNKDAIVHWKTATESVVQIWKSAGHIGLDALTAIVIMIAFTFMLGQHAIIPLAVYGVFFIVQIWMKLKTYKKILLLNQLKDQKLTYLIGMSSGKRFFKMLSGSRIRKRWMEMTESISIFNLQIVDQEEKSSGILKLYSSASIIVIFVAAYFAIQAGELQQSAVIALMLLNGRCTAAISALSTRLYQTIVAKSKMEGAIRALNEEDDFQMYQKGVTYQDAGRLIFKTDGLDVGHNDVTLVKGLDVTLYEGMSMAIIGPAGSGKSSLLRVLAGLESPKSGEVLFNGVSVGEYDSSFFQKNLAYYSPADRFLDDSLGFNATLKLNGNTKPFEENLKYFGAKFATNQTALFGESVDELNLSSGQYQLAKMIQVLGKEPDLIVFDEPCSHLSPAEGMQFMNLLRARYPRAVIIYSSHSVMLTKQANIIFDVKTEKVALNKS